MDHLADVGWLFGLRERPRPSARTGRGGAGRGVTLHDREESGGAATDVRGDCYPFTGTAVFSNASEQQEKARAVLSA